MSLKFNINSFDDDLMNLFLSELKNVKDIMESDDNVKFHLNVRFSKSEMEILDLNKFATISVVKEGFACYPLATYSSSFYFFKDIICLELVEVKIND